MLEKSIDKEFLDYFMLLNKPQKESLLSLVKSFLGKEGRISAKTYNEEIEAAEKRIASGKNTEHTELEKQAEQW